MIHSRLIAFCILTCSLFSSASPDAADQPKSKETAYWVVYLGEGPGTDTILGFIDLSTVTHTSPTTRTAYEELYFAPYNPKRKATYFDEFDCKNGRSRMLGFQTGFWSKPARDPHPKWTSDGPESHNYSIGHFVCADSDDERKKWGGVRAPPKATPDELAAFAFRRQPNQPSLQSLPQDFGSVPKK